jgi:hypothetical protein
MQYIIQRHNWRSGIKQNNFWTKTGSHQLLSPDKSILLTTNPLPDKNYSTIKKNRKKCGKLIQACDRHAVETQSDSETLSQLSRFTCIPTSYYTTQSNFSPSAASLYATVIPPLPLTPLPLVWFFR